MQQWFMAAWKLQAVWNMKIALLKLAETFVWRQFRLENSIALLRFYTKCSLDGQNGHMLKILSLFQSAGNKQAITTKLFCWLFGIKILWTFRKCNKKIEFLLRRWLTGRFSNLKILNPYFGHQMVDMVWTGYFFDENES